MCEAEVAANPFTRFRGLMGRRSLGEAEGLLLDPASSIHTHFMRFAIDAVFLDRDARVTHIAVALRPWRIASRRGSKQVLELPAGASRAAGIEPGDRLVVRAI